MGDNIHVIRVPEPGDGEVRGLANLPYDEEQAEGDDGDDVPELEDAGEPLLLAASSSDHSASSQATETPTVAATSSRPIATPSGVWVTTSRSVSDGADSGLGEKSLYLYLFIHI